MKGWTDRALDIGLIALVPLAILLSGRRAYQWSRRPEPLTADTTTLWHELRPPEWPTSPTNIEIVWFSDIECPFCRAAHRSIQEIAREAPNATRVEYRHYPLSIHPGARRGATLIECARTLGEPGKMIQALFGLADITGEPLEAIAARAGVADVNALRECENGRARPASVERRIEQDSLMAENLGALGTPVIVVNGLAFLGFPGDSVLRAHVAAAAARR